MKIAVFKTGTHTDSNGNTRAWTEDDLDKIAGSYNPALHEAPVVIGHPKENSPAWGWVEGLRREGNVLYARLKALVPEFTDMLGKGMFKKRSISLYPDMTLRHIGFLGAVPPAVKGLPDFAFAEKESVFYESEWPLCSNAVSEIRKNEKEEKIMGLIEKLRALLSEDDKEEGGGDASPEDFSGREAALGKRECALRKKENEVRKKEIAGFVEDLKRKGVVLPAMERMGLGDFLEAISETEKTYEFGEMGKGVSQLEFMKSFLSALPVRIVFEEAAGRDKDAGRGGGKAYMERLLADYMEKNKGVSYKDALIAVSREHPGLLER